MADASHLDHDKTVPEQFTVPVPAQLVERNLQGFADDRDLPLDVLLAAVTAAALERASHTSSDRPPTEQGTAAAGWQPSGELAVTLPDRYWGLLAALSAEHPTDWCARFLADTDDAVLDELLIEAIDARLVPLPPWVA